jgi:hypothetical protein
LKLRRLKLRRFELRRNKTISSKVRTHEAKVEAVH